MNIYYKSVGRGALLLLNSTPDTTGLIPQSHVKAYNAFGNEIKKRFDQPIQQLSGEGEIVEITLSEPTEINHAILQEDLSQGQRVLSFQISGMDSMNQWHVIYMGTSIGNKRICYFNPVKIAKIKLSVTNSKANPQISNFAVYNLKNVLLEPEKRENLGSFYDGIARKTGTDPTREPALKIDSWDLNTFNSTGWKEMSFDLTKYVTRIGQYELSFSDQSTGNNSGLEFREWKLQMYGGEALNSIELLKGTSTFRITRSQQTLDEFPAILNIKVRSKPKTSGIVTLKRVTW
jgi:alpha-L-fucosidase